MINNIKLYKTFRKHLLYKTLQNIEMSWGGNVEYSKKVYVEAIMKNMNPTKPYMLYSNTVLKQI